MAKRRTKQTAIIVRPDPPAAIQSLVTPPKVTVGDIFRKTEEVVAEHRKAAGMVKAMTDAMLTAVHQNTAEAAEQLAAMAG
jgi:hypothetical protein